MTRSPGRIITFYSYKGGTGRSMAMANVAWILASHGKRVLAIDWDLEAPGLHRYFSPFLVDRNLTASDGIIDFVIDYATEAMTPAQQDEVVPPDWYVQHADLPRYAASLEWEGWDFPGDGTLDFVSAGRQSPSYSTRVNTFDWQSFYDRHGGGVFLEAAKETMRNEYDYILIDSRTGVSDTSGICTVQMPDVLVVCFTLNNQSIEGASAIASSVYAQRCRSGLKIFPVPMRIELAETDKLEARRKYARRRFGLCPDHLDEAQREEYWGAVEIPYIPYYAYEEVLATFKDRPGATTSLLGALERLTSYLTDGEVQRLIPMPEPIRQEVLEAYVRRATEEITEDEKSRAAETSFATLLPDERAAAHRLFIRLVRLEPEGLETRARVPLQELDSPPYRRLVHTFLSAGVLAAETDPATQEQAVQLADEKLLARWPRLRAWIEEDRDFLLWRQNVSTRIAEWEGSRRDAGALLRGAPLRVAQSWRNRRGEDLTDREMAYLQASVRNNLHQNAKIAAVILILVLAGSAGFRLWKTLQRQQSAAEAVRTADQLVEDGQLDQALQRYSEAIQSDPKQAETYLKRARVYQEKGDLDRALIDLNQGLDLDSSFQEAYLAKAEIQSRRGDDKAAIQTLEAAVALPRSDPDPDIYLNLANLYSASGNSGRAIECYTQAIKRGRDDPDTRFSRGLAYLARGSSLRARDDFRFAYENSTDENTRVAARAQLLKLGFEQDPAAQTPPPRVYLHYSDPADDSIVNAVAEALRKEGFDTELELIPKAPTAGDVRWFFLEDRISASAVQQIVEDRIAQEGYPLELEPLYRKPGKIGRSAKPGLVEVWLPPLATSARSLQRKAKGG